MNLYRTLSLLLLLPLAACGISDNTLIADLTADDAEKVCKEFAGYDRSVTCTINDTEYTIDMGMGSESECVSSFEPAPAGCTMTMGDIRDCMDAMAALSDEEICTMTAPPAECDAMMMNETCSGEEPPAE